jgi:hypothetical protein
MNTLQIEDEREGNVGEYQGNTEGGDIGLNKIILKWIFEINNMTILTGFGYQWMVLSTQRYVNADNFLTARIAPQKNP